MEIFGIMGLRDTVDEMMNTVWSIMLSCASLLAAANTRICLKQANIPKSSLLPLAMYRRSCKVCHKQTHPEVDNISGNYSNHFARIFEIP
jgi:hypothetical protein